MSDHLHTCQVGMWNLPAVELDLDKLSEDQRQTLESAAKETGATILKPNLFSWRSQEKRDWFTLKYG